MSQEDLDEIRSRIETDRRRSVSRSLADYVTLFPGQEELVARAFLATRDSSSPREALVPGSSRLGSYRLLSELGRGGQGVVYLAEDERLKRRVALKVLYGLNAGSASALARFRREAEVASKLQHPGICAIYDAGIADDVPFIAMQYVEGTTLAERIAGSRRDGGTAASPSFVVFSEAHENESEPPEVSESLTSTTSAAASSSVTRKEVRDILLVFEQAARALHSAHEAGVIHRDVKPANIMLTPAGQPILLDFGLARADDAELATLTQTGDLFGTPAYMSPEQLMGDRIVLDRRTDIYSLAASLFEALTLRRPFEGHTREALYQAILGREAPDLRRLNPRVPEDLAVVVHTALDKDRDRRYATAEDMAEELRRVREHEPIVARRAGPWTRTSRWARRNPAVATMLVLLILVLGAGLATALVQNAHLEERSLALKEEAQAREIALAERSEALAAKQLALEDFGRLADRRLLVEARREAATLWPARPVREADMVAWLERYRPLGDRLSVHAATLAQLRATALPYDEEARKREHALALEEIRELERRIEGFEEIDRENLDSAPLEVVDALEKDVRARIDTLREEVGRRGRWEFADDVDAWKHEVVTQLVGELERFVDPDGGDLADLEARLQRARTIGARTVEAWAREWRETIARIESGPRYGGLSIIPQAGLIPLGPDPDSGLEEFLHFESHRGDTPTRDDRGRLRLGPEAGAILVLLPGGTARVGAQASDPEGANHDGFATASESPVHAVELRPFLIGKHELTQAQWEAMTGKTPSFYRSGRTPLEVTPRNPVESITWQEARAVLERHGLLLPTEVRWEYAARAGTESTWYCGSTLADLVGHANIADNSAVARRAFNSNWDHESDYEDGYATHAPVGRFSPNPWGLHDVHGNVWEWCRDAYVNYHVPAADGDGLREFGRRAQPRAYRGGGAPARAKFSRSAARSWNQPDWRYAWLGIRPAAEVERGDTTSALRAK